MYKSLILTGNKEQIFSQIEEYIKSLGLTIIDKDALRPWGGFFVIDEKDAETFGNIFFKGIDISSLRIGGKLSPKILITQPDKRLSWQYHHRRAEIWKLVSGVAGVATSLTDEQGPVRALRIGEVLRLKQGERHRLIGTSDWGMIAEIWQHTDPAKPSDESDIIRVQDDFGRKDG